MGKQLLLFIFILSFIITVFYTTSCVHQPQTPPLANDGNYPADVANIIMVKCAIAGCHNQASYKNANGLLLDTWEHLFDGGNDGADVIAYSPLYSPLLYVTNTDSTDGKIAQKPTMPYSTPGKTMAPLSTKEYLILYNWIAAGAPDKNGNIPFATNPDTRQKIYLTQSGSDLMAVIDGQKKVVMRYFSIGMDATQIEFAHDVEMAHDGKYAYISFYSGNYLQKVDVATDKIVAGVNLNTFLAPGGTGWSVLSIGTGDSQIAVTNYSTNGGMGVVNTANMTFIRSDYYFGSNYFSFPHGVTSNKTFDTFYYTEQYGNTVNKFVPNAVPYPYQKQIAIKGTNPIVSGNTDSSSPNPHQIAMAPDYSKYFVTCQGTNEVRVIDANTNAVLAAIPVGLFPQEMALSPSKHYLLVTCQEDQNTLPGRKGTVYVIDYNTYQVITVLNGDFYQPHDICVDEQDGYIYIPSTNANPNGPAPHHSIAGGGRAGWYTVYSLDSLKPVDNKRYEVLVNPYSISNRF